MTMRNDMDDPEMKARKRTRSEERLGHKLQEAYDVIPFGRISQTVKRRHKSDEADDRDKIDPVISRNCNIQKPPEDCVDLLLSQPWVKSNDTWTGAEGGDMPLYRGKVSSKTVTRGNPRVDLPSCTGVKRKMSLDDLPHPNKLSRRTQKKTPGRTRTQGETNNLENHLSQLWRKQCICKPGVSSESGLYMRNLMKPYHFVNTPDENNQFHKSQTTGEMKINLCRENSPNTRRKFIDSVFDTEQMVPSPSSFLPVSSVDESQPHMWDQASFWQNSYQTPIENEHDHDMASGFPSNVRDEDATLTHFPILHHSPLIAKVPDLQTIPEIEEANLSRPSSASSDLCSQLTSPKHFEE